MLGLAGSRGRLTVLLALLLSTTGLYYLERNSNGLLDGLSQVASKMFGNKAIKDAPPTLPPYGAVVAAARGDEDLSWLEDDLFQKKCVHVIRYRSTTRELIQIVGIYFPTTSTTLSTPTLVSRSP